MTRSAKTMVILASVVFLALCLSVHSAGKEAPTPKPAARTPARVTRTPSRVRTPVARRVKPAEDPHKDSVILLEAFMIQVRLSALYSLGVPQISRGPDCVSADHILKLLKDTDSAVVTAGAKLAIGQNNKANTDSTAHQGTYTGPPEKRRMEYVDVGTSFMAIAEIQREGKIFVELEFEHSGIEEGDVEADTGTLIERKWSSGVYLEAGKPTLVGATQDVQTAAFLIVTANIKE